MAKSSDLLITEREFIERLVLITGHNKDVVRDIIKAQYEFVVEELCNGIPVRVGKLGEFHIVTSLVNGGYDFNTHQAKPKKMKSRVKFYISAGVKIAVNKALNDANQNQ